jgi:two-component system invasion response regulator UvrY
MKKIIIADDHTIVRKGLMQILVDGIPGIQITEVADGNQLIKEVRSTKYDMVISDLSMPGRNGMEALKQLKEEFPKLPVLILSMHPEDQYALRVIKAGASGYLTKDSDPDEMVKAVTQILNGRKYITASLAERLAENIGIDVKGDLHETLSDREFDVMKLIASGKTVSEIAEILSLSVTTISTYRARILEKMNMKTNAEITHYAIESKLV